MDDGEGEVTDPARKRAHDLWLQLGEAFDTDVTITMKNGKVLRCVVGDASVDVTREWRDPSYVVQVFDRDGGEEITINVGDVETVSTRP